MSDNVKKDKFKEKCDLTYEQLFFLAYNHRLIPVLKRLVEVFGSEKILPSVRKACRDYMIERTRKNRPDDNSLQAFVAPYKEENGFFQHTLEYDILEDSDSAFELKITRCKWAETFREAGAEQIGHAIFCSADKAEAETFNPKLKLSRSSNMMTGDDSCLIRWEMRD